MATNTNNSAPSAPTPTNFATNSVSYNGDTSTIKNKVNATKVTQQQKCPDSSIKLQTSPVKSGTANTFIITPLPSAGVNAVPAPGSPSTPTLYKNITCGTLIGSEDVSFKCSLVASIKLNSCMFKLEAMIGAWVEQQAKLIWSFVMQQLPGTDFFEKMAIKICKIASFLQQIMCLIKQVMDCILSTIQFITQLITWIISLPMIYLSKLISCVTSYISNIVGGLSNMTNALNSVFSGVLGCQPYVCNPASSVYDIQNTAYDVGNSAGSLYNGFSS
jgi:hypothetical protein